MELELTLLELPDLPLWALGLPLPEQMVGLCCVTSATSATRLETFGCIIVPDELPDSWGFAYMGVYLCL